MSHCTENGSGEHCSLTGIKKRDNKRTNLIRLL